MKIKMKYVPILILILITSFLFSFNNTKKSTSMPKVFPYDSQINNINGEPVNLNKFKDKNILFVNVASMCGFTSQYNELEKLYSKYKNDLIVIGCPSNQFGQQEPGSHEEILNFCKTNYGVSFLLTEKINVKGDGIHPIYRWLTSSKLNGVQDSSVKWNFQKYFIDKNGHLVDFFYSTTDPLASQNY